MISKELFYDALQRKQEKTLTPIEKNGLYRIFHVQEFIMVGCLRFSIGIFTILCMVSFSAWAGKGKQIAWEDQAGRQKPNLHFRIHEKVENKKVLFNNGVKYLK
jgi:hypothetical protein